MNIYEVLKAVGFGNMRPVSVIIALNRGGSSSQARSRAAGADCGRNPLRFSLFINCSMRARSRAEEKPHQAGVRSTCKLLNCLKSSATIYVLSLDNYYFSCASSWFVFGYKISIIFAIADFMFIWKQLCIATLYGHTDSWSFDNIVV